MLDPQRQLPIILMCAILGLVFYFHSYIDKVFGSTCCNKRRQSSVLCLIIRWSSPLFKNRFDGDRMAMPSGAAAQFSRDLRQPLSHVDNILPYWPRFVAMPYGEQHSVRSGRIRIVDAVTVELVKDDPRKSRSFVGSMIDSRTLDSRSGSDGDADVEAR